MKASLLLSAAIMVSSAFGAPKIVTKTAVVYVTEKGPAVTVKGAPTPCPDEKKVHHQPVYTTIKYAAPKPAPKPPVYTAPKPPVYAAPKPAPEPAPEPVAPSGDMAKSCVQSHNDIRSKHAAPPLTWDEKLVYTAEISASNCMTSVHNAQGNGENRASVSGNISKPNAGEMVRNQWYSNELSAYMSNPGVFSKSAGHLTQVLWKSTSRVGCALRYCNQIDGGMAGYLLVCQYQTPGNYAGEFAKNVQV